MARPRKPMPIKASEGNSFPLTDEHCALLDGVCSDGALCGAVIEKCKRAGYDVADYELVNARQTELASGLKREFFPDRA